MTKNNNLEQASSLLESMKVPEKQRNQMCCLVLLAMADLKPGTKWSCAQNNWKRIHDIITFVDEHYGVKYAENSRETIRKQAMHHFRNAAFIEDNGMATNSPNYRYRLTDEMLELVRSYGKRQWNSNRKAFLEIHQGLMDLYDTKRKFTKTPVVINGSSFSFSPGKHNELQKAIIEEFAPRFAPGAECLYVGDTIEKDLVFDAARLSQLGVEMTIHDKLPDVMLYSPDKNWLYFVEAVTSVGPMTPARVKQIQEMTEGSHAGRIYVTAFLDLKTYKKFADQLAWDTEVWIAEMPDHMIHLNGDRFLGPRN